jgi:retinol dehydrogenase-12
METNLSAKTYVVTGATSGIGLAAAEILLRQGACVIGVGRSAGRCQEVENRLRRAHPASDITCLVADLSSQGQVRALAAQIRAQLAQRGASALDGLLNNAGTFTYWLTLTPDGFETQWAVNHLAPFLLTNELLPLLQAAPAGRVVTVSSGSHYGTRLDWADPQLRRHYNGLKAYGSTKLANVLFTLELNRRLGPGSRLRAFAADPGLVKTDIGFKGTPAIVRWVWRQRRAAGIPPEESARGIVYLLTEPSLQESGEIYWQHGRPKAASRYALDRESAARLWSLSESMCGVRHA